MAARVDSAVSTRGIPAGVRCWVNEAVPFKSVSSGWEALSHFASGNTGMG